MKPLANRVLVYVDESASPTKAGLIHLPTMEKPQYPDAKVIAVGSKTTEVKVGDTVMIDRYAPTSQRVTYQGRLHFILAEQDIIGIITPTTK